MNPVRRSLRRLCAALAGLMLSACASTPQTRFYTLMPPTPAGAVPVDASYAFELLPVSVPDQVDLPQLVIREGDGRLAVVEARQWIAPLGREIRAALSDRLSRDLGVRDVYRLSRDEALPVYRVKLDVLRFESLLGHSARLEASWSVDGRAAGKSVLVCGSALTEPTAGSYEALVEGHQRALARLADGITAGLRSIQAGVPACPR